MNILAALIVPTFSFIGACDVGSQETPPARSAVLPADWRKAEAGVLAEQTQLTFADRFLKAGESYFSPDDKRIIFQAVQKPPAGEAADEFYAMYIADVKREQASGKITGIDHIRQLSPKGSANTCGWFHPTDPNVVIFASTVKPPVIEDVPGFERLSGRYKWMFPRNMKIVRCKLDRADGSPQSLEVLVGDDKAYCAECSLSNDGRHLLYCSLEGERGDIYVKDLKTQVVHRVVQSKAYDGGPFFSPDGKRICYRSDRRTQHYLQLYVADLAFNELGEIVGISREYQLTDDEQIVHWCPYWTLDGRHLIYGTSELGHTNYEVFVIDADPGDLKGSTGTIRYGTHRQQVTHADRADVLPSLSHDGKTMIWTSQRGEDGESQIWAASFVINPDATQAVEIEKPAAGAAPAPAKKAASTAPAKSRDQDFVSVTDPETDRIYVYYPDTKRLAEYDMSTHATTDVTDPALKKHIMELLVLQDEPQ